MMQRAGSKSRFASGFLVVWACWISTAAAVDAPQPRVDVLMSGLAQPADVVVRPLRLNPVEVYVLERGAGRVVKVAVDKPGVALPTIIDFPTSKGDEPGPRRIRFLDQYSLLVASQGNTSAESHLNAWPLDDKVTQPGDGANPPQTFGFANAEQDARGLGRYVDAGIFDGKAYLATVGLGSFGIDDETSPKATAFNVLQAEWSSSKRKDARVIFRETKALPTMYDPRAAIPTPRLEYLTLSADRPGGSERRITFVNPVTGRSILELPLPLPEPVAIGYQAVGNKPGMLYALDRSKASGGLYRLEVVFDKGVQVLRPLRVLELDRPTAFSSGEDGTLYITIEGAVAGANQTSQPAGQLLKVGGL